MELKNGCPGGIFAHVYTAQEEFIRQYLRSDHFQFRLSCQSKLFVSENDSIVEQVFSLLNNADIKTVGPEIIFDKIYDYIGFKAIPEDLFRHLVIARAVYRFLDKLSDKLKSQVE